jgi:hypothetical protein
MIEADGLDLFVVDVSRDEAGPGPPPGTMDRRGRSA